MKSRTEVIFKRKQLRKLLTDVEVYSFSDKEQELINNDIKLLEWVLSEKINLNTLIKNKIDEQGD